MCFLKEIPHMGVSENEVLPQMANLMDFMGKMDQQPLVMLHP